MNMSGKSILIYLFWAGFNGLAVVIFCSLRGNLSFSEPSNTLTVLALSTDISAVFLLPLFVQTLIKNNDGLPGNTCPGLNDIWPPCAILILLIMPLAMISAQVSNAGYLAQAKMFFQAAASIFFAVSVGLLALSAGKTVFSWYYLYVFTVTAGLPLLNYLFEEFGPGNFNTSAVWFYRAVLHMIASIVIFIIYLSRKTTYAHQATL